MFISFRDESPQLVVESSEVQKKAVKRPKRPKPPPIELKPAGKGILVMPRINLLDEAGINSKKNVVFADKVKPGEGTSSSEGEEILSPPLPIVQEVQYDFISFPFNRHQELEANLLDAAPTWSFRTLVVNL